MYVTCIPGDNIIATFCCCLSLQDKLLLRLDDADHIKTNETTNDDNEVLKHVHENEKIRNSWSLMRLHKFAFCFIIKRSKYFNHCCYWINSSSSNSSSSRKRRRSNTLFISHHNIVKFVDKNHLIAAVVGPMFPHFQHINVGTNCEKEISTLSLSNLARLARPDCRAAIYSVDFFYFSFNDSL